MYDMVGSLFKGIKSVAKIMRAMKYKWFTIHIIIVMIEAIIPFILLFTFNLLLDSLNGEYMGLKPLSVTLIYSGIILFVPLISILHNIIIGRGRQLFSHQIDLLLAKQVESVELSFLDSLEGQDILDEFDMMKDALNAFPDKILSIFSRAFTFVVAFVSIIPYNYFFGLLLIALTIPFTLLNIIFDRKSEDFRIRNTADVRKFSYYKWMLTDRSTAKDIRMYDLTNPILDRYNYEKNEYLKENKKLDLWKMIRALPITLLKYTGEFVFLIYLVTESINGNITIGDLVLYSGLALSVIISFGQITTSLGELFEYDLKHIQRYDEFETQIPRTNELNKINIFDFESIVFDDVHFKYPNSDDEVIKGVSFTLNKGERLSIVGINGAGKTTLIKLLMGYYPVSKGEIRLNGIPLHNYNIYSVRKLFGTLFQSYSKFNITLRENVALSSIDEMRDDQKIINAITLADAVEVLEKCNGNLDTFLEREFDDNGVALSGGQWQKVALARVYFKNAPIFIFDEPSAALDAIAEDAIFKQVKNLSTDKTCIMISHRISFSNSTTKIIVLDNGKIAEMGTHEELLSRKGIYEAMYQIQKERYERCG